ncbi:MAG: molybdopterin-binding protein [Planctomycetota bacterium]
MQDLKAEIISIGDEMTSGARLDTNSQWLSRRLGELGIEVLFHTTVGDSLAHNAEVFATATRRADVVIATGGLGPTRDDLTREVLAKLVNEPLELRELALQHIETMFARRQREMPERNKTQAMFPRSAEQIFNPQGTAPGIDLAVSRDALPASRVFALPGVPAEMKTMFDQTVVERLIDMGGGARVIRHHVMRFFGTGESDMEQSLGDMIARDREPRVGITVSAATISLRITAMGNNEKDCSAAIESTRQEVLQRVGHFHFGDGDELEQHHAVESFMRDRDQSLLVVELGFAAPLGDWFAALGPTRAYHGGLSLANPEDLLRLTGQSTEGQAAQSLLSGFGASHLLLIDSYPRIEPNDVQPVPASDVDLVVMTPDQPPSKKTATISGHPAIIQPRIAKAGLAWLRRCLVQGTASNGVNQSA